MKQGILLLLTLVLLLPVYLQLGEQAQAQAPVQALGKIGVVDFAVVLEKYDKTGQVNEKLEEMSARYKERMDEKKSRMEQILLEMETMRPDSADFRARKKDFSYLESDIKMLEQQGNQEMMAYLTTRTQEIYHNIQDEIAAYGKTHGYDLIVKWDDVSPEVMRSRNIMALNEKIQTRPVLYYHQDNDLTQAIIDLLNE